MVVLAEYIFSRGAGIDLLLFPGRLRAWAVNDVPGRPSPYSAVTFLVTGLSLALLDASPAAGTGRPGSWHQRRLSSRAWP